MRAVRGNSMPFVEVNCAAIPEELIESEMFGHRKGSFTGASEDKVGKFQKADGGTLFLDEVGDMSLKTQSKVLRVLEEQRVEPLGSNQPVNVDVRVIAATNKKLEEEIGRNAFREDLFYRLNVIPFYVPALRERTEDIPILAAHFLEAFCAEYGKKPKEFSARGDGSAAQLSVAGKRARAEEPGGAAGDHVPFARKSSRTICRRSCFAARRRARRSRTRACRRRGRRTSGNSCCASSKKTAGT